MTVDASSAGGLRRPVRLGAIVCDALDEPARSVAGDYADLYAALFGPAGATVHAVDARADELPDVGRAGSRTGDLMDGWVLGGSRRSVGDDRPWLHRLETWVRAALAAHVPLVGICFGHQLIAHCAGGAVGRSNGGWTIGAVDYAVRPHATVVPPVDGSFRLVASHRDQVLVAPEDAEVFASSTTCPVAGFTIGGHVTCVQGHPEFPAALAATLYESRAEAYGAETVAAALATLDRPTDNAVIGRWLVDRVRNAAT